MTRFQLPSAYFPDNAITRAESVYQRRAARNEQPWLRWIKRAVMWLMIAISLLLFGNFLLSSILQIDPHGIDEKLMPLPILLVAVCVFYHLFLTFQTMSLAANTIVREKESQTWEILVLTGIDARQIVRGKWWATVQYQLPRYLLLGLLHLGATTTVALSMLSISSSVLISADVQTQVPSPVMILLIGLLGLVFTFFNLGFSAACGVMASTISKRSTMAILRGFGDQIALSLVITIAFGFEFNLVYQSTSGVWRQLLYPLLTQSTNSLIDNGLLLLSQSITINYQINALTSYPRVAPIPVSWIIAVCFALIIYALLIWLSLFQAENNAVRGLATSVNALPNTKSFWVNR